MMPQARYDLPRMRVLCLLSVLFSALLAFSVQPLIAKRLLPSFGGSAAVWVTCLVAFQGLLLLGYLYAHFLLRAPRALQIGVHAGVLTAPLLVMPFGAPHAPAPGTIVSLGLAGELLRSAALPFFALSTNSTLVQQWFARRTGQAPWFLYAASNAGSLIGLLGYPLFLEPWVGLQAQAAGWRTGYVAFSLLTAVVVFATARTSAVARATSAAPPARQVARWIARAALGAMLLCAVSFWVTQDVASLPLLWVVPLALYLLTFVLAFSPRVPYARRILVILCMLAVVTGLESLIGPTSGIWFQLASGLGALFLGGWILHGDLARDRPAEDRLSEYYLWIAFGGLLGGVTGNVLAPVLFDSVAEYPLALALLAFALAAEKDLREIAATFRRPSTWLIVGCFVAGLGVTAAFARTDAAKWVMPIPVFVLLVGVVVRSRPGLFGAGAAIVAISLSFGWIKQHAVLDSDRSFYGTLRINESGGVRTMVHGTTIHGIERMDRDDAPGAAYYHPAGPLGGSLARFPEDGRVGVIGLGAGTLAYVAGPGQTIDFFEIDPMVETLARRWFRYLSRAKAHTSVEIGDARLTLERRPDASFDGLIIDAFSSDAIPVHLLTREAVELYFRKLKPGGVVVFHISNRYFDLGRVLRGTAEEIGATALRIAASPTEEERKEDLATDVVAVALATSAGTLAPWSEAGWLPISSPPVLWTDDASSLVPLLGSADPARTREPMTTTTAQ